MTFGGHPLRRGLTYTNLPRRPVGNVVAARDARATELAALVSDVFGRRPCFILGAGASASMIPPRLSAQRIEEFVGRCRDYVGDQAASDPDRLPFLAAILDVEIASDASSAGAQSILEGGADAMNLDPTIYKDLKHLPTGALTTLISLWLSAETQALRAGPRRAGYDLLGLARRGSLVITTNQDRLTERFTSHLDIRPVNGQVDRRFTDPKTRAHAASTHVDSDWSVLPSGFVLLGQQQPDELVDSEEFRRAWADVWECSAVIVVGYSFAGGLDVGCWREFCDTVGQASMRLHVVDPSARDRAQWFASGLSSRPARHHTALWHCLGYAVFYLMRRYPGTTTRDLAGYSRELVRLHDELRDADPALWPKLLDAGDRGVRPKSLRL